MKRRAVLVAVIACAIGLSACSHPTNDVAAPRSASTTAAKRPILVTMGSNATFGRGLDDPLRDGWPQLLYHAAFPLNAVFVNASDRTSVSLGRAAVSQLPLAIEQHANVVAMWLGDTDLAGCPANATPAYFEQDIDALIRPLREAGTKVLAGNLLRTKPCAAVFDAALDNVARERGATVVDLASALASTPNVGPSTSVTLSESRKIASAFAVATTSS